MSRSDLFERIASAGHLTSWAARLFARSLDRRIRPFGLSVGQVTVFLALAETDDLPQRELVRESAVEQPAMVGILKRMEASGLVVRRSDPEDRRTSLFALTPTGRASLAQLHDALDAGNSDALAGFDDEERALLITLLRRMIRNLIAAQASGASGGPTG